MLFRLVLVFCGYFYLDNQNFMKFHKTFVNLRKIQ